MRAQLPATVIALGCSLPLAACEWLYPSVDLSAADGGTANPGSGGFAESGSPGSTGSSSGPGSGSSSGSESGSSSGSGTSSSSGGGSSGSGSGSSSGSGSGALPDSGPAGPEGGAPTAITFVQINSQDTNDTSIATVSATYSDAQQAGDLNVVVVGWADPTNQINAISDSAGNAYVLTAAPGSTTHAALAIYYAKSVAGASSNTVTVDLDANDFLSLAILEYAGVTALDQTAVTTGTGSTASTSTVTTAMPHELVLGAGEPDQSQSINFVSAGAGFTERVITPISGMLVEDMIAPQAGSFNGSGGLTKSAPWVMQVVTFR